jgi:hypothetical protein
MIESNKNTLLSTKSYDESNLYNKNNDNNYDYKNNSYLEKSYDNLNLYEKNNGNNSNNKNVILPNNIINNKFNGTNFQETQNYLENDINNITENKICDKIKCKYECNNSNQESNRFEGFDIMYH